MPSSASGGWPALALLLRVLCRPDNGADMAALMTPGMACGLC